MGRGVAHGRDGDRPHRARRRNRGLRARPDPRPTGDRADRRVGADAARLRPAGGALDGRGRGRRDRGPARARAARRGGPDHAPLPDLLALQDAAPLPRRRRLVHLLRAGAPGAARCERDGRVDSRLLLEAHGRLAAQHGRLEHLAEALLRPAAAVLPVRRLRPAERGRLARRARGTCHGRARPAPGAPSALDRRGSRSPAKGAGRRFGASPRSATPGSTRASSRSRRSAGRTRSGSSTVTRPGLPRGCPERTCPISRTGSSGSPRIGSPRAGSRSASGSTRCSSCP